MFRTRNLILLSETPCLLKAAFWVVTVRLGLTFFSLNEVRQRFLRQEPLTEKVDSVNIHHLARSVQRIANKIPDATCLTRAQALQIMLARRGVSTRLMLGVARPNSDEFRAHAWLEKDGEIVIGGTERKINAFTTIADFGPTLT